MLHVTYRLDTHTFGFSISCTMRALNIILASNSFSMVLADIAAAIIVDLQCQPQWSKEPQPRAEVYGVPSDLT